MLTAVRRLLGIGHPRRIAPLCRCIVAAIAAAETAADFAGVLYTDVATELKVRQRLLGQQRMVVLPGQSHATTLPAVCDFAASMASSVAFLISSMSPITSEVVSFGVSSSDARLGSSFGHIDV